MRSTPLKGGVVFMNSLKLYALDNNSQQLHRCSQRKRPARKTASEGGLSRNVGQTTFV